MSEGSPGARRVTGDRMSLLVKIARMYHEQGLRQPEIAARLHISQSRVSRFLKEAGALGIVRTVVVPPPGTFSELEERSEERRVGKEGGGGAAGALVRLLAGVGGVGEGYICER